MGFDMENLSTVDNRPAITDLGPKIDAVIDRLMRHSGSDRETLRQILEEFADFAVRQSGSHSVSADEQRLINAGKATLKLSHAAKNILQMVGGAVDVMQLAMAKNDTERVDRSWQILKPNMQRLKNLMLDLLSYSRDRKFQPQPGKINDVIKNTADQLSDCVKEKNLKLKVDLDSSVPESVFDAELISEMCRNLIINAVDSFLPDKNGTVSVQSTYDSVGNAVTLTFADDAGPMPEEYRREIFNPYELGNNKLGTGLGVPLAVQIVELHEGNLTFEPGEEGTKFTVSLPITVARQEPAGGSAS